MYLSKSVVMFLGIKKRNFNDSVMWKIDVYLNGEVDSFFVQDNNPILTDFQKFKPTNMITVEVSWQNTQQGWKHRLLSVSAGV